MSEIVVETGDQNANVILKFITARAESTHKAIRDDVRAGDTSLQMNLSFLAFQNQLEISEARAALNYLDENEYLRVENSHFGKVATIWMKSQLFAVKEYRRMFARREVG